MRPLSKGAVSFRNRKGRRAVRSAWNRWISKRTPQSRREDYRYVRMALGEGHAEWGRWRTDARLPYTEMFWTNPETQR